MRKQYGLYTYFIVIFLLLAACSAKEDSNISAIQHVIENEFTGPNEEYIQLSDEMFVAVAKDGYEAAELQRKNLLIYSENKYKKFFTENGFANFLTSGPAHFYHVFSGDYQMSVSDIEIKRDSDHPTIYRFTFKVKVEESGNISYFDFKGEAICPEEGKIGKISYSDENGGLSAKLNEISNQ